ncbi:MAG: group 1 truncated hemoglobin [Alphaproteobacteria bacterium]
MAQGLYENIGGQSAVDAAVDLFYRKVLNDARVSQNFEDIDMDEQRTKQKSFLTMVFGGPYDYTGQSLRDAHKDLVDDGLNDSHFNVVAVHLQNTLDELGVPSDLVNQVMAPAAGTRDDVLNR